MTTVSSHDEPEQPRDDPNAWLRERSRLPYARFSDAPLDPSWKQCAFCRRWFEPTFMQASVPTIDLYCAGLDHDASWVASKQAQTLGFARPPLPAEIRAALASRNRNRTTCRDCQELSDPTAPERLSTTLGWEGRCFRCVLEREEKQARRSGAGWMEHTRRELRAIASGEGVGAPQAPAEGPRLPTASGGEDTNACALCGALFGMYRHSATGLRGAYCSEECLALAETRDAEEARRQLRSHLPKRVPMHDFSSETEEDRRLREQYSGYFEAKKRESADALERVRRAGAAAREPVTTAGLDALLRLFAWADEEPDARADSPSAASRKRARIHAARRIFAGASLIEILHALEAEIGQPVVAPTFALVDPLLRSAQRRQAAHLRTTDPVDEAESPKGPAFVTALPPAVTSQKRRSSKRETFPAEVRAARDALEERGAPINITNLADEIGIHRETVASYLTDVYKTTITAIERHEWP